VSIYEIHVIYLCIKVFPMLINSLRFNISKAKKVSGVRVLFSLFLFTSLFYKSCSSVSLMSTSTSHEEIDAEYPGTAVSRMMNIRARAQSLSAEQLSGEWESVRKSLLWAGGLRDITDQRKIGLGYTGHSFNDFNHVDCTAMIETNVHNLNDNRVAFIHAKNKLGDGIIAASLPELGTGGSWSTCMQGCNSDPPLDVAHVQFRARIAFKLVWIPPLFTSFVLVDDAGSYLNSGNPTGKLPPHEERAYNYRLVQNSKYSVEADKLSTQISPTDVLAPGGGGGSSCSANSKEC
jgi:hypothetical protein